MLDEFPPLFDDQHTPPMTIGEWMKPTILDQMQKINNTASCVASDVFIVAREGEDFFDIEGVFSTRKGAEAYIATQESKNIWGELFCTKWSVQP